MYVKISKICIFKNSKIFKLIKKKKELEMHTEKTAGQEKLYSYGHMNSHCYKISCLLSTQVKLKWEQKQAKNVEVNRSVK